jgi:hypothetical protein
MKKRRIILLALLAFTMCFVFVRSFCGVFVIQPIGALPEGATILYWRNGLNLPFIASADGILGESEAGVSLLGRAVVIAGVAEPIMERKIVKLGYSETLYLWSTGGRTYEK